MLGVSFAMGPFIRYMGGANRERDLDVNDDADDDEASANSMAT